jgi:hypothetical protein
MKAEVNECSLRGRPWCGWTYDVKRALDRRDIMVEVASERAMDRL